MSLLEIEDLTVHLPVAGELRTVLHGVSLALDEGEALGLVGESGSGKSMTARAIARLLPPGAVVEGRIAFDGAAVLDLRGGDLRAYRTDGVGMIFQDPRAHTNPVRSIGDFLCEGLRTHRGLSAHESHGLAVELLGEVGIEDGERRLGQYPHELSGGLLQRVMIASVLAMRPQLILADEPTTALDVTTQSEVLAILDDLRREHAMALLFITHDLELAAAVCERTAVMYAGSIVEDLAAAALHAEPLHPYTAALLRARPSVTATAARLAAIPGRPLSAFEAPAGCAFAPRCNHAEAGCRTERPAMRQVGDDRVRCHRAEALRGRLLGSLLPDAVDG